MRFKISKIKNEKLNKKIISSEIVKFQKLVNFLIWTICKTIKTQKISNLMVKLSNIYFECSNNLNSNKNKE